MIKTVKKAHYRAEQFFASLNPTFTVADWKLVDLVLGKNEKALSLFYQMSAADRQHAIAVLKTLMDWGATDSALHQAALLHDVGKSMGQPLPHRVIIVLLKAFRPQLLTRLAAAPLTCRRWRRPFAVHARHPQIGAAWAKDAGCHSLAIKLIETHQHEPAKTPQTETEKLHQLLFNADGVN